MTRQRFPWSPEEDRIIRSLFPVNATHKVAAMIDRTTSAVFQRARILGVEKCPEYLATSAHRRNGHEPASRKHQFKKGHVPANKGLRRPGWAPGRMAQTQFKKGQMTGAAQRNYQPIGTEKIRDGYLVRKLHDEGPYPAARWQPVHRLVWEQAHGPVPKGHVVVFKHGKHTTRRQDITLDRVELVTRAELMRRNSFLTRYPKDVADLIRTRGVLNRKINQEIRREKQSL